MTLMRQQWQASSRLPGLRRIAVLLLAFSNHENAWRCRAKTKPAISDDAAAGVQPVERARAVRPGAGTLFAVVYAGASESVHPISLPAAAIVAELLAIVRGQRANVPQ